MAYGGSVIRIPLGTEGLRTDEPYTSMPPTVLTEARNVWCVDGKLEKDGGSTRWSAAALSAGVVAMFDYWPDTINQRLIVLTRAGIMYRYETSAAVTVVTATGVAPTTLVDANEQAQFLECGEEVTGRASKLFLFSARNPVQVISGDGTTRANLATPAADWTGPYPVSGALHRGRVWALGGTDSHRAYASDTDNHEQFVGGNAVQFSIFPGEGDGLTRAFVYKGRLFFFKRPRGVYYLDDSDPDSDNWSVRKVTSEFGLAGPHAVCEALDDLLAKNRENGITSLAATDQFGDVEKGDLLRLMRCKRAVARNALLGGIESSHMLYYEERQLVLTTYRSTASLVPDRIAYLDFNGAQPKLTFSDKDQPNCLAHRRDIYGVLRPIYGSEAGWVYELDRESREVAGAGYAGIWKTPEIDFGFADAAVAEREKRFDFLELVFEETGNWNVDIEYWVDRRKVGETLSFDQSSASDTELTEDDAETEAGLAVRSVRLPLHAQGRRIMFRGSNSGLRQNFKLVALVVYFQAMGEDARDE